MKIAMKSLTIATLAGLSLGLSACDSSSASPAATATPDAADVTAASIDGGASATPNEVPPAAVVSQAEKAAK